MEVADQVAAVLDHIAAAIAVVAHHAANQRLPAVTETDLGDVMAAATGEVSMVPPRVRVAVMAMGFVGVEVMLAMMALHVVALEMAVFLEMAMLEVTL